MKHRHAAALAILILTALPAVAQAEPDEFGDGYLAGDFGRIRYEENGAKILRAEGDPTRDPGFAADVNLGIFPGDRVETGPDQRVEVQLGQGSLVRVDRGTRVTFLSLPDPYAEYSDHAVLQVAEGSVRLNASIDGAEEFRVDTPAASIYLLSDTDLRVEVWSSGRTRVQSRRGVAEVVGAGGSVLIRGGMRSEATPGSIPDTPVAFHTFEADDFDRWVAIREEVYLDRLARAEASAEAYDELPEEVRPYHAELSASGTWIDSGDQGWVWAPSDVGEDWRPYRAGYWDYGPQGYFWVSNEPWGWAPYHYGRWNWVSGYGWCWVPGRVFAGAWVSWSWGSAYIGWSALDPWGYPIYHGPLHYGYYDPYAWVFVGYDHFYYSHRHYGHHHHRPHHEHYKSVHDVGDRVRDHAIVTRPPKASPRELADSGETRARVLREVQSERRDRVARTTSSAERSRRFDRAEQALVSSGERSRLASRSRERATPTSRSATATARPTRTTSGETTPTTTTRTRSTAAAEPRGQTAGSDGRGSRSTEVRTYPRVISPGKDSIRKRGEERGGRSAAGMRDPGTAARSGGRVESSGSVPRVQPRESASGSRIREMYRSVARPRQTQSPSTTSGQGSSARSGSTARPTPSARPSTPSRSGSSSTARPAPSRSSGRSGSSSTARPAPSRSSGRSGSARPQSRSSGSSGRKSSAARPAPSRSTSGGSRSARPSTSKKSSSSSSRGSSSRSSRSRGKKR